MDRVVVTKFWHGLAMMQVCCVKDATDEEILAVCNFQNPSGTTGGWQSVCRCDYKEEQQRPVQCQDHLDRFHILVSC